tara:strand:- start:768 stop:986 length:219 start_codon:yes stop_codon:yes gene_type:complete
MTDKAIVEWIEHHLDKKETNDLWDLQAAILTELSKRDSVSYRVRASNSSVRAKLDNNVSEWDDDNVHDSEGC